MEGLQEDHGPLRGPVDHGQQETALDRLGLPDALVRAYAERGLTHLYDWQAACLAAEGVADGRNLVYCAPTSGGKTLVSEIIMLRRVWDIRKRAIFVLPYVSVVSEKAQYLKELCRNTRIAAKGFHGGSPESIREHFDIAVCTIEKANHLVNYLIEEGTLAETVGTLVVDELHLLGDGSRGYMLEVTVSKILLFAPHVQIIGMSATLPNVGDIATWLGATLYSTSFRPVPLREFVLLDGQLHHPDGSLARKLELEGLSRGALEAEATGLLAATWEVTREGHSALVFCASRQKCEQTAALLAELLPDAPVGCLPGSSLEARERLLAAVRQLPCGPDPTLERTLPRGVAFHHGALTTEERSVVERGYRQGAISVICATSTLAAGVNLPARRVIFSTPYMGKALLDASQYKQMAGRAGRAGQGSLGEAVVIASSSTQRQVFALLKQSLPGVSSCLRNEVCGLKRLVLEVISARQASSGEDLIKLFERTLVSRQRLVAGWTPSGEPMVDYPEITCAMQWLLGHDMTRLDERSQAYVVTPLGQAVCSSAMDPEVGFTLFQEMERARPCVSLDTDLHVCYLVTPCDGSVTINWRILNAVLRHLSSAERRVADRVGVRLDLVDKAAFQGMLANKILASLDGVRLQRFYSALVLWAILHETPTQQLLQRFQLNRGQLQMLQQTAASFTATVAVFCNRLQWYSMEALILSFQQRLTFGVRSELVPLMQIENMDCVVARALYEHGFTTPVGIAGARASEVLRVLRRTLPHNVPSAALPESTAERLIEASKAVSKAAVKEKRRKAREARNGLRVEAQVQAQAQAQAQAQVQAPAVKRQRTEEQEQPAPSAPAKAPRGAESASSGSLCPGASAGSMSIGRFPGQAASASADTAVLAAERGQPQPQPAAGCSQDAKRFRSASAQQQLSARAPLSATGQGGPAPQHAAEAKLESAAPSPVAVASPASVATCATPCRADHLCGGTPGPGHTQTPRSTEQIIGEGLRRLGRSSLTPRDVEAVASPSSPQAAAGGIPTSRQEPQKGFRGCARSSPSSSSASSTGTPASHPAKASEAAFLASWSTAAEGPLELPNLQVVMPSDVAVHAWLAEQLLHCSVIGASVVDGGGDGTEVLCIVLGPCQALGLVLPQQGPLSFAMPLWHWLSYERNLCISSSAKDLVGALLRRGHDVSCSLAEPRIAQWLLDPDDKQGAAPPSVTLKLKPPSQTTPDSGFLGLPRSQCPSLLVGSSAPLEPALRARVASQWPACFLAVPQMAILLRQLSGQMLLESFWLVEMPFAAVLAWMEHLGVGCEARDPCQTQSQILYKSAALEEQVRELVGRRVNLNSSEDVGRAIFDDLGLPVPLGTRFRRKTNGRFAYRSPVELLRQLPANPVVDHVLEYRHLCHALRRFESLLHAGAPRRPEPRCSACACSPCVAGRGTAAPGAGTGPSEVAPGLRLRTEFLQTGTATGRLATASGSLPLLNLDNPFPVREVWRPSLHEELQGGAEPPATGTRVFIAVASEAPPRPRRLREGSLQALLPGTCSDLYGGGAGSLAAYWADHGWEVYRDEAYARRVRQVQIQLGSSVLTYPADKVWRLAAPVRLTEEAPVFVVNPRRLLVAESGWVLLSVDYSQLEVRLMAHFSQDELFMKILQGGGDLFRHVAAKWLRKPEVQVTAEERSGAKRICYGLVYGVGTGRLATELGISRAQATEFQESFMREFRGIATWVQTCRARARQCGFVETLHGRRRFLPGLAAREHAARSHAERQAVNTTCQASAADLVKTAMLRIHVRLRTLRIHEGNQCRLPGLMLLQIHDELLFEIREDWLERVQEIVVSEMIGAGDQLRVPLQVKWKTGRSWGTME